MSDTSILITGEMQPIDLATDKRIVYRYYLKTGVEEYDGLYFADGSLVEFNIKGGARHGYYVKPDKDFKEVKELHPYYDSPDGMATYPH